MNAEQILNNNNSSILFDYRLAEADVVCTSAHITMLVQKGILSAEEGDMLTTGLDKIAARIASGQPACKSKSADNYINGQAESANRRASWRTKLAYATAVITVQ